MVPQPMVIMKTHTEQNFENTLLVDTSRFISSRIKDGTMVLVDKEIVGNLNFTRYEEE